MAGLPAKRELIERGEKIATAGGSADPIDWYLLDGRLLGISFGGQTPTVIEGTFAAGEHEPPAGAPAITLSQHAFKLALGAVAAGRLSPEAVMVELGLNPDEIGDEDGSA